jgi:hypothetical protein
MTKCADRAVPRPRRRRPRTNPDHAVYELDVWLADSDPLIWRTLAMPADFTLDRLHRLLQQVMEWEDYHQHSFETRERRRFEPKRQVGGVDAMWSFLAGPEGEVENEVRFTLRDLFDDLKDILAYEYDFGDGWVHGIKLIGTHADPAAFAHLPMCLDGRRAGPPEGCGGVWGYAEKLEILRNPDPNNEWHRDVIEWIGGADFDPERFDVDARNRLLKDAWSKNRRRSLPSSGSGHGSAKRRTRKSR